MRNLYSTIYDPQSAWIFAVIKPGFLKQSKEIVDAFEQNGWHLVKTRTKQLLLAEARLLYKVHKKEKFYDDLCTYMASDLSVGLMFTKNRPMTDGVFKETNKIKNKLRAAYGESDMRNVLHSSDSLDAMKAESTLYF